MASNNLATTYKKWNGIASIMRQAGLPDTHWSQLAAQDIKLVENGGQPMTNGQILDALSTSITGQPTVQHTNSDVQSPLDLLGNIVGDVRSFPENFVTGAAQYVSSLPTQAVDFVKLLERDPATQQKYGMETGGGPGAFIRDMARVPVFSAWVPGLHTVASATSEQGRKELEAHPGYALLDVGAGASEAGRMGLFGGSAEAGSPLEALQQGNPYKAAGRGIMDAAAHLPAVPERAAVMNTLTKLGWGSDLMQKVLKPLYTAQRMAEAKVIEYTNNEVIRSMEEWAQKDPQGFEQFNNIIETGDPQQLAKLPPEQQAILTQIDTAKEEIMRVAQQQGAVRKVVLPHGEEYYSTTSDVGKLDMKVQELTDKLRKQHADTLSKKGRQAEVGLERMKKTKKQLDSAKAALQKKVLETPPERFVAPVVQKVRERVQQALEENVANADDVGKILHGLTLEEVTRRISNTGLESELMKWVGREEYTAIKKDALQMWQKMAEEGYNPRYVTNVDSALTDVVEYPKIVPGETHTPRHFVDRGFDLGRTQNNIAVALTQAESDVVRMVGEQAYFNSYIKPLTVKTADIEHQYLDLAHRSDPQLVGEKLLGRAKQLQQKDYVEIRVDTRGAPHGWKSIINPSNDEGVLLPKEVANALDRMSGDKEFLHGKNLPGMNLFKMAVLTGPRHMAHIMLGGLVFTLVREPEALRFLKQGWEAASDPAKLPSLFQSLHNLHDDGVWHFAAGKTIGRTLSGIPGALSRVEEHVANTYKAAVMLSEESKGFSHQQAVAVANKVLVDMDNMTPFEKQVVRQVFPFYGFTKHILRYAFTLPIDHPIRMAFLANLARRVQEDDKGTLPGFFNTLFFLGKPDAAGNVTTVDFKNVNPFRSLYNEFTLGGVLSSLNPYVAGVMEASGLNVLSATPELYPDLQVDPQSGQLVARRQAPETALKFSEAFVPEVTSIDAMLGLSNRMKGLKDTNPEAFHRALWTSLNMPFVPGHYNLNSETQKLEMRRFTQAQKDVSSALRSGDFSYLEGYNQIPVPAYLKPFANNAAYLSPYQLAALWQRLQAQYPGVNPKAVIPRSRSRSTL